MRLEIKSCIAKDAEDAKEKSLTAKDAKPAKEKNSFTGRIAKSTRLLVVVVAT